MNSFEKQLASRSPLAASVLELSDYVFDQQWLSELYAQHRGRGYEDVLSFESFLTMMRDALLRYRGSAHAMFLEMEEAKTNPVDESSFYRKLSRMNVDVSRALLRESAMKLNALMPAEVAKLPNCFDDFAVVIGDGKKIKNVAKRLEPARGFDGKLIGAKALTALDARTGLALAMSDSLDGLCNDVPLVPALMEQLREVIAQPMLSVWDRQFDDVKTMRHLCQRQGDAFVVRMKQSHTFAGESIEHLIDNQGRSMTDEIGVMGKGKNTMRVRRVTLFRPGEEDVILLSNLLDRSRYSADDLLVLYRHRWGIEQVFQQVTETFSLQHLIGCSPRGVLLQFAFCLLLYNMMQVIKAYVAEDGKVLVAVVSMHYLFDHTRRQLQAWAYHTDGNWPRTHRDSATMCQRLRELLKGSWKPKLLSKAADKKPRGKPKSKRRLHGGHSSVQRVLEGRAKVIAA